MPCTWLSSSALEVWRLRQRCLALYNEYCTCMCHVISPSPLCDDSMRDDVTSGAVSVLNGQLNLRSHTALIWSVPVSPVHIRILSIQDIQRPSLSLNKTYRQ